jgi:hypothetical protein
MWLMDDHGPLEAAEAKARKQARKSMAVMQQPVGSPCFFS